MKAWRIQFKPASGSATGDGSSEQPGGQSVAATPSVARRLPVRKRRKVGWAKGMLAGFAGTLVLFVQAGESRLTIADQGELAIGVTNISGPFILQVSEDLERWMPVTTVGSTETNGMVVLRDPAPARHEGRFYRVEETDTVVLATVLEVRASGAEGTYTFSVEVVSPDLGCEQYADWWEVLSEDGRLLYRRILAHSHVMEQPFTRSGGPVPMLADQVVWIRAHMSTGGYGGTVWKGSVTQGFAPAELDGMFASGVAVTPPLPSGCAF